MTASTLDEIATTAAWMLPGATRRTVEPHDPDHFVAAVAEQRVSGLVTAAAADGALQTSTPHLAELLQATHLEALRTSLAVEAASVEVSTLLGRSGLGHALLKGCATARLDYPDPSLRITGDVDVLVDRSSYAATLDCLEQAGIGRLLPPFRSRWEQQYGKDIALRGAAGIEIDLHLGLVGGYFGVGSDTGRLLDDLVDYPLGGHRLPALDPTGRIVHAAIHSAGGPDIRLGSAADVIVLAANPTVTAASVAERSRRLRCAPLVAAGIVRAARTFGIDPDADHAGDPGAGPGTDRGPLEALLRWAAGVETTAAEAHALGALSHPGGEGVWLSGVRRLPWSRRAGYVAPLLLPSRDHLRARGRTLPGHLRLSVRHLAGR